MTMVAGLIDGRTVEVQSSARQGRIARVEVLRDLQTAEAIWRQLERPEQFATPYQRFDFLDAWQDTVGRCEQLTPYVVAAFDAERQPLMLLPMVIERGAAFSVARFPGGNHATFNMPLWQRHFAQSATAIELAEMIEALRAHPERPDVLALSQQPVRWRELSNPMALLPHQQSTNACPLLTMPKNAQPTALISSSFRRRLKGKERKLQALPGYRYNLAATDADIKRLLDAFFRIKPIRMAQQKLPNVFADPGVEDFIRAACLAVLPDGNRAIEMHALECDDDVIAIFAGVADGQRFSMMFNTYTLSESSRYSPGLILMRNIIDHYAAEGYNSLDLGIGSDDYKLLFCKDLEPIFDSFIALTPRGRLAAGALSSVARAKRLVKQTPLLMQVAQWMRNALHA